MLSVILKNVKYWLSTLLLVMPIGIAYLYYSTIVALLICISKYIL